MPRDLVHLRRPNLLVLTVPRCCALRASIGTSTQCTAKLSHICAQSACSPSPWSITFITIWSKLRKMGFVLESAPDTLPSSLFSCVFRNLEKSSAQGLVCRVKDSDTVLVGAAFNASQLLRICYEHMAVNDRLEFRENIKTLVRIWLWILKASISNLLYRHSIFNGNVVSGNITNLNIFLSIFQLTFTF